MNFQSNYHILYFTFITAYLLIEYVLQTTWIKKGRFNNTFFRGLIYDVLYALMFFAITFLVGLFTLNSEGLQELQFYFAIYALTSLVVGPILYKSQKEKRKNHAKFELVYFIIYNVIFFSLPMVFVFLLHDHDLEVINSNFINSVLVIICSLIILVPFCNMLHAKIRNLYIPYAGQVEKIVFYQENLERILVFLGLIFSFPAIITLFPLMPRLLVHIRSDESSWNKDPYLVSIFTSLIVIFILTILTTIGLGRELIIFGRGLV